MKPEYKPVPPGESNLFKAVILGNEKEFKYAWHYHPEYQLTYILSNKGVRYVGNSIENYTDDELVLLGPDIPHCWINSPGQETARAIIIYFREPFFHKEWMQSYEFDAIRKLMSLSHKGIKFDKTVALKFKEDFLKLFELPPLEKLMLLLKILNDLSHCTEYRVLGQPVFSNELDLGHNERIHIVYTYIERHYQQKITLEEVAAQVNMSKEYFSRFFSKIMKKSFFNFLNGYRIDKACKLLRETDKQISEICYASGFESVPFFYRQFKKFKGCQPKAYRLNYDKA